MGRTRPWLATAGALISLFLATLTLIVPDWIEEVSGYDPDRHSGAVEWLVALGFAAVAVGLGVLARRQWRASLRHGVSSTEN